jgi:hypothetical protein
LAADKTVKLRLIKLHKSQSARDRMSCRGTITKQVWQPQGNESRLTSLLPQYPQQIVRISSGALSAAPDGSFVGDLSRQIGAKWRTTTMLLQA